MGFLDPEDMIFVVCCGILRAFKVIVTDPDSVLGSQTREVKEVGPDGHEVTNVVPVVSEEVKEALIRNSKRRMTSQPSKIRADIEMRSLQLDGVLHIKDAMRKAEAVGNDECPVRIKLVAPPLYVLTTQTLDKERGLAILNKAIEACSIAIEKKNGKLVVKEPPRMVSDGRISCWPSTWLCLTVRIRRIKKFLNLYNLLVFLEVGSRSCRLRDLQVILTEGYSNISLKYLGQIRLEL
ncbi:hypothetical protein MLD38_009728 [Melastoma candidum]|uniref:Uncharacterized protein n=1 Tax=Melastoma candidum TaxID=119954 RepID=A0ACB9RYF1_9MYRT|nr:hypothetical protein MLD38_009728 [Melastoma candidum]